MIMWYVDAILGLDYQGHALSSKQCQLYSGWATVDAKRRRTNSLFANQSSCNVAMPIGHFVVRDDLATEMARVIPSLRIYDINIIFTYDIREAEIASLAQEVAGLDDDGLAELVRRHRSVAPAIGLSGVNPYPTRIPRFADYTAYEISYGGQRGYSDRPQISPVPVDAVEEYGILQLGGMFMSDIVYNIVAPHLKSPWFYVEQIVV
ncbi:MAG: hypothetical protein AAGI53_10925 [Planctomycetota bacterium]